MTTYIELKKADLLNKGKAKNKKKDVKAKVVKKDEVKNTKEKK